MRDKNKNKPLHVLSIDFDYFIVNKDQKAICFYPDGQREYEEPIMNVIWASNYAAARASGFDMSRNVTINKSEANLVKEIIERQVEPLCMVVDSHVHLHDFIIDSSKRFPDRSGDIIVYNVDFHHDTYTNGAPQLHCGNWLLKLMDANIVTSAHWISAPDSSSDELDLRCKQDMTLKDLCKIDFDLVFVCRSGSWTPPHLDSLFIRYFAKPLVQNKRGWPCRYQRNILSNRYSDRDLQCAIAQVLDVMTGKLQGNNTSSTKSPVE